MWYSCHGRWAQNDTTSDAPTAPAEKAPLAGQQTHSYQMLGLGLTWVWVPCAQTLFSTPKLLQVTRLRLTRESFSQVLRWAPTCSQPVYPSLLLLKPTTSNRTSSSTTSTNLQQVVKAHFLPIPLGINTFIKYKIITTIIETKRHARYMSQILLDSTDLKLPCQPVKGF